MAKLQTRNSTRKTTRLFVLVLLAVLLLSLTEVTFESKVSAAPDEARWSSVDIPGEGEAGNWVLAEGSDVRHLAIADDGTLYCYASPSGTDRTLFKSTDNGNSWSYTGGVTEIILGIAAVPGATGTVYYATESGVYRSTDAGISFTAIPAGPGGAGSNNIVISCVDVARAGDSEIVAVGTADWDNSEYGGVYTLDVGEITPSWTDTGIGDYDACALAFSPEYATDGQLIAVVTDEQDTIIANKTGGGSWNQVIGEAVIQNLVPVYAAIAFPDDYNAGVENCVLYVGIDTGSGNGDVYEIATEAAPAGSVATDLGIGASYSLGSVDVAGLAASGSNDATYLLAGSAGDTQVYYSGDSGVSWERSIKQPTGESDTFLVIDNGFSVNRRAYTSTTGAESAFSCTSDGGMTWNQSGLIDTGISANGILGLAVSPNYSQDTTLFMMTFGGMSMKHSLWRSGDGGEAWGRVYCSAIDNADSLSLIELSPGYVTGTQAVFLAGNVNGVPAIWKSTDNGQSFIYRAAPYQIGAWAVLDDDTAFLGSFDGSNGLVYKTEDSGVTYSNGVPAGTNSVVSIAVSPNYAQDGTILASNNLGWVYCSGDYGNTFNPLPLDAVSPPFSGSVTVAFDAEYAVNNVIYAASSAADEGIYRFAVNQSDEWERIDGTVPAGSTLDQLAVSADGVLYAANSQSVDIAGHEGGMERSLNPASQLAPTFETVVGGLDSGVTLRGIWLQENQLWSIDTHNTRLLTYIDSLTLPVNLNSPADELTGTGIENIVLDWEILNGATGYRWQLDYDTDFSNLPLDFEGDTGASSVHLPELDMGTTYYWRVRATEPVLSPWSDIWSFTTALGQTEVAPVLLSPGAGDENVLLNPMFQWSAITGAEEYELVVSSSASFSNPVIKKTGESALPVTAWRSDINLKYNTTYYWKVRAVGLGSYSAWSAVGVFTTEIVPAVEEETIDLPVLLSPGAGADDVTPNPLFQWSSIAGARKYELIVARNAAFSNPVIKRTGSYTLPVTAWQSNISLDYNSTYYWKVRAADPSGYSSWSSVGVFTTESPSDISQPVTSPMLLSPGAGAEKVSPQPLFQWDAIAGAVGYELEVSGDTYFDNNVIVKAGDYALPATAWQSNIGLDYDTTYYWRVRAIVEEGYSTWSAVGAFLTESLPVESNHEEEMPSQQMTSPSQQTPSSTSEPPVLSSTLPAQQTIPNWAVYLGIGLFANMVLLQITVIILIVFYRPKQDRSLKN
jgi:hypothetical protein